MLPVIRLVQDEGIRFRIWETACALATSAAADEVSVALRDPGRQFSVALGRQALSAAHAIPEQVLTRGMNIDEEDLKRAAVDRAGPAPDVTTHRKNVEDQRKEARAYQALLLLAIGTRRSRSGRRLLEEWAQTADSEIAVAARAGLAICGVTHAIQSLEARAGQEAALGRVRNLLTQVVPPSFRRPPRPVSDQEDAHCSTCGRTSQTASHLMAGSQAVMCDQCVLAVGKTRRDLPAADDAHCSFCDRTKLEVRGLYDYSGVCICASCLELSMGLLEREEVNRFLATW
jgi:hypothetical protein